MTSISLAASRAVADAPGVCFHCGLDIPQGFDLQVPVHGRDVPVCCHGCAAAVQFVQGAGLDEYYRFREAPTGLRAAGEDTPPGPWSDPAVAERFVRHDAEGDRATLALDGLRCAACSWLIETGVGALEGVRSLHVDSASARLDICWAPGACSLDAVTRRIRRLGFDSVPAHDDAEIRLHNRQRRRSLRAVGVSGIVALQVMMLAIADYAGMLGPAGADMDTGYRALLLWGEMVLATVSVVLTADSFLAGAWRALRARHLTMDVPVALAVLLAWSASVALLLTGAAADGGHLYFDSVTMFVFLLLLGRHLELTVRHRFARSDRLLGDLLPAVAHRLDAPGDATTVETGAADPSTRDVPADSLIAGQWIRVLPGETIPADGRLRSGDGHLDRALLTGESEPVHLVPGDPVDAGCRNLDGVLILEVLRPQPDSAVAGIPALLQRARSRRSRSVGLADRAAALFLGGVLLACAAAALLWLWIDPARVLPVVLATLIVTCPCALSLATPTALTAAAIRLRRSGVLLADPDALETIATCNEVCLDKTGTVTEPDGRTLERVQGPAEADAIVAALEADAEHPVAVAVRTTLPRPTRRAEALRQVAGAGVEGSVDGHRYRFGSAAFTGVPGSALALARLGDGAPTPVARYALRERLAPDAARTIDALRELGLTPLLLSGDVEARVADTADRLGIRCWRAAADPATKLAWLQARQQGRDGARILYVGDGINDAPALGGASASVAMGSASDYARRAADAVLLTPGPAAVATLVEIARATRARIRFNLGWAFGYNLLALPLAMAGLITPWMAAIGMSASSLVVTLASAALLRRGEAD